MKKKSCPEYSVVMHAQLGPDKHAVMVSLDKRYAVCCTHPKRAIATAPNYAAKGNGMISAPLSLEGMGDLLQWTDRKTALDRYNALLGNRPGLRLVRETE